MVLHPRHEGLPSFTTEGNGLQAWKAREEGRGMSGVTGKVETELWQCSLSTLRAGCAQKTIRTIEYLGDRAYISAWIDCRRPVICSRAKER